MSPVEAAGRSWARCCADSGWRAETGTETVPVTVAVGRRTAGSPVALWSSPAHDLAAMDGIAVRAVDTAAAPLVLTPGAYDVVDTGDPLPPGRDAVVMREHVRRHPDGTAAISAPVVAGRHVRPAGEDVAAGEVLVPTGHRLRPVDVAVLAGAGHTRVEVLRLPRVAVLPTGDEVRPVGTRIGRGEILDTNSPMLAGMIAEAGGLPDPRPIVADDPAALRAAVRAAAAAADLVLVIAGSSAGRDDHTAAVLADLGRVAVQGVAMRPGHPVVLGVLTGPGTRPVPVVGVPGYPVAAAHVFATFVAPLLARLTGTAPSGPDLAVARLAAAVPSPAALDHTVAVRLDADAHGALVAVPVLRGAGVLSALMRADGLLRVPAGCAGLAEGTAVTVERVAGAPAAAAGGCVRAAG